MIWVRKHAPVDNATEMCILYSLADRANDDGTGCWPSNETIADEARCSPRTVKRHMKELASRGLIVPGDERMVASYRPDRRPNVWDLNMSLRRGDTGCQNDTPDKGGVSSGVQRGDNGGDHGVSSGAQRGDTVVTQTIHNPPVEPPLTPQGESSDKPASKKKAPTRHEYTPEFEEFWKMWPNQRGQSKFEASKKFTTALKAADAETILEGARQFAADPNLDVDYCPAPTTWLNNRRWEAGPLPARNPRPSQQARSGNSFDDWMPPMQGNSPELDYNPELFNATVIDHQEGY